MALDLAGRLRAELSILRREGRIPIELRLSQQRWNELRTELRTEWRGERQVIAFEGVPCVLTVGIRAPEGYRIRLLEPKPRP